MIAIILPAYNEEISLPLLIQDIRVLAKKRISEGIKIIIVDDGSTDHTAEYVRNIADDDLLLVQHQNNRGLGEAIKTGLLEALNLSGVDAIVTMDADNTHNPGLLEKMILALGEGNDVVIASRYRPGARIIGVGLDRAILSLGMSWLFRLVYPIRGVRDYSCGYRAYKPEILRKAFNKWGDQFITQSGFTCMVEILIKLSQINTIFYEVPLVLRYDLKQGKSKMNVVATVYKTLNLLLRERFKLR